MHIVIYTERVRTMGYILPIRSLQSEQYANRLQHQEYRFATIQKVAPIPGKTDFTKEYEQRKLSLQEEQRQQSRRNIARSPITQPVYSMPNPANLSPAIAQVVQKGMSINQYI